MLHRANKLKKKTSKKKSPPPPKKPTQTKTPKDCCTGLGRIWVNLAHWQKLLGLSLGMIRSVIRLSTRPRRNRTKPFSHQATFGHGVYHKNRKQLEYPPRLNKDFLIDSCMFWLDLLFFSKEYLIIFAVRAPRLEVHGHIAYTNLTVCRDDCQYSMALGESLTHRLGFQSHQCGDGFCICVGELGTL